MAASRPSPMLVIAAILVAALLALPHAAGAQAAGAEHPVLQVYVALEGVEHGPLDRDGLIEMVRAGTLKPDTPVWRAGMDRWKPAGSIAVIAVLIDQYGPEKAPEPEPPPALEFHVLIDRVQVGPLLEHELRRMVRDGRLTAETLVWRPGMEGWQKAGEIESLAPLLAEGPAGEREIGTVTVRAYCAAADREGIGTAVGVVAARSAAISACVANGGTQDCCAGDISIQR